MTLAVVAAGRALNLPWQLELGEPFFAPYSKLVAPVRLPDGTEAVAQDRASTSTPRASTSRRRSRFWDGQGAVRLIDHDPATRAMLIERCVPGTPLGAEYDESALEMSPRARCERLWRAPSGRCALADAREATAERWSRELPERYDGRAARRGARRDPRARADAGASSSSATRTCTAATSCVRSASRGSRSTRSRSSPSAPTTRRRLVRDARRRRSPRSSGTASTSSASGSGSTASASGSGASPSISRGDRRPLLPDEVEMCGCSRR